MADGRPVALGARGLDVLTTLVAGAGELVTKEALLQAAWPGLVVEEANVHVQVSQLRKVLGKTAIVTVGGLGYRFALPLQQGQAAPSHNLPTPATHFVGRQAALATAAQQLLGARLLTLTGIGGMGKTRLALKLAEQVLYRFAGGVWFVDLVPLQDARDLPLLLLRALGLPAAGADALAAVLAHLRRRELLLVLDNCEHLRPPADSAGELLALLSTLLAQAPGLVLLATSREALNMAGERVFVVHPLQSPPAGAAQAEAAASEAVQLFVQRAQADAPDFVLEPHSADLVADICRRLDGIPLAVELAAARIKMLSVRQLHALLAQRFALLSHSSQALPRQQTLLEVLRWSFEHLPAPEQRLLAAVSVCSAGFELETACALAGEPGHPVAVLDRLALLAERALIQVNHRAEPVRYQMLETVREYMLSELTQSGQQPAVLALHHQHFFGLAKEAEKHPYGPAHASWAARLDGERENLLAALAFSLQQAQAAAALAMVVALKQFWFATGLLDQGLRAAESALALAAASAAELAAPQAQADAAASAAALRLAAQLCLFMGHLDTGMAHAQQALALSETLADEAGAASALCFAGRISVKSGQLDAGQHWLQEGLRRARQSDSLATVAEALNALAFLAIERNDLDSAEACFTEGLQTSQKRGSELGSLIENLNLAWVAVMKSGAHIHPGVDSDANPDALDGTALARQRLLGVWQTLRRMPHRYVAQELVDVCASYACRSAWFEEAVLLHEASQAQRDSIHLPLTSSQSSRRAPELAQARTALGDDAYEAAAQAGRALTHANTLQRIGAWLAQGGRRA